MIRPRLLPVVTFFALATTAGCRRAAPVPPPPVPAVVTTTVRAEPAPPLSRRGAVATGARLRLGFNAAGVIATMKVKTGDSVRQGQLIAKLKDGGASATLQASQATQSRALRDYGAASKLAGTGAVAPAQKDDAKSALDVARANASLAAELVAQRQLVSPISGTVVSRLAEPGEAVAPGMPVVVIDDTKRLVVKVAVNERELPRLKPNQTASVVVDDLGKAIPAVVSSIALAPLEDGLYPVEVSPKVDEASTLRPGTLTTVRFDESSRETSITIPLDALVHRNGKTFVFVVAEGTKVRMRELTVARAENKDVAVRTGLTGGERIVREGAEFLEDGQIVRVID
jgi:RND family efflux transporter MFP subunit